MTVWAGPSQIRGVLLTLESSRAGEWMLDRVQAADSARETLYICTQSRKHSSFLHLLVHSHPLLPLLLGRTLWGLYVGETGLS